MRERNDPCIERLILEIAVHVEECPQACDTLDGIRDWWLIGTSRCCTREQILDALESLVAKGLLVRSRLRNGEWLYRGRNEPT